MTDLVFSQLGAMTAETFEPLLGETFRIGQLYAEQQDGVQSEVPSKASLEFDGSLDCVLVEVNRMEQLKQLEGSFEHRPRPPFSLLFRHESSSSAEARVLDSGIRHVCHPTLGEIVLSLNPVQVPPIANASHTFSIHYESIFA